MKTIGITSGIVVVLFLLAPAAKADKIGDAAARAEPMRAAELAQIYGGKTWRWTEGAGYFAPDRRFVAWSGSGDAASYAEGRWSVTDAGRMCFKAVWRSKAKPASQRTCFRHRKAGASIYQLKEPDGGWYIFRSNKKNSADEYNRLKKGDAATEGLEETKAQFRSR